MADELLSQRQFAALVGRSNVWVSKLVKSGKLPTDAAGKIPKAAGLVAFEAAKTVGYDANRAHAEKQREIAKKVAKSPSKTKVSASKHAENKAKTGLSATKKAPVQPVLELPDEDSDGQPLPPPEVGAAIAAAKVTQAQVADQYNKAKTAEKMYMAKLRELEFKERQGNLLAVPEVEADAARVAGELMDKLRSVAPRIASQCEGEPARVIEGIIDEAINEALAALHKSRFVGGGLKAQG